MARIFLNSPLGVITHGALYLIAVLHKATQVLHLRAHRNISRGRARPCTQINFQPCACKICIARSERYIVAMCPRRTN